MTDIKLPTTGERYLPEFKGTIRLEHLHRYRLARKLVEGLDVLDVACGEGYGSALIADQANSVIGVDISEDAIAHAKHHYTDRKLDFRVGSAAELPLRPASVDVVVSFETIEHLAEQEQMMEEIRRVLKPGGLLMISSPNKEEYTDKTGYRNPFHVKELYTEEFEALVGRYFAQSRLLGQRVVGGSLIMDSQTNGSVKLMRDEEEMDAGALRRYDVILASDSDLPEIGVTIYEERDSDVVPETAERLFKEKDEAIFGLRQEIEHRVQEERDAAQALREESAALQAELAAEREASNKVGTELSTMAEHHERLRDHAENLTIEYDNLVNEFGHLRNFNVELERIRGETATALGGEQARVGALYQALDQVLKDKWWRRTKGLRLTSNWLRERRGRPKKKWPKTAARVLAKVPVPVEVPKLSVVYLERTGPSADAENVFQLPPSESPYSGGSRVVDGNFVFPGSGYHIPMVNYSDIKEEYVAYQEHEPIEKAIKTIAFYLPQFHPFPENDEWWGKGFTEWTNVGKATPLFDGHYQPHCPIHLGYYDLRLVENMVEQAKMAKNYGIDGFAYYFYWFGGTTLLETPLQNMLKTPEVDIPFFFIWANENWTRRWDGAEHDVLMGQDHSPEDSRAFIRHLKQYFEDPRYIRVDGKPVLSIYRAEIIPDLHETMDIFQDEARAMGFPGLHLIAAQTFGYEDPTADGFEAAMEFPPHKIHVKEITEEAPNLVAGHTGKIWDYDNFATQSVQQPEKDYKCYPTAMLSWDNTARKGKASHLQARFSLLRYSQWLSHNCERVVKNEKLSPDERFVFVNAWNEWAEGTHLEPDQKYGFGYLETTRRVCNRYPKSSERFLQPEPPKKRKSDIALIFHCHYPDTWEALSDALKRMDGVQFDLFVSVTSGKLAEMVVAEYPDAHVEIFDNRGRDVRPFIAHLKLVQKLGYKVVCKLHGKKSVYRADGDELRIKAFDSLMRMEAVEMFEKDENLGILAAEASKLEHDVPNSKEPHKFDNMRFNQETVEKLLADMGRSFYGSWFPAGTMFWFRPEALSELTQIDLNAFDIERGLADGTLPHAIERIICILAEGNGFKTKTF
ncbi:glycoside hydrolase family 99-like domain-containing protein [Aliiruegeria sabulilitoris]|uniref:glycoside hydrolase family 99-like domain-containing protein n=1 Tax=Aliiruegeria sabulilitoris TaxID=1510458 RepID=UPI0008348C86|nr:glycoside hydrolase family 99-like domain-containing protein [Aliiruegeria sabulilitoris]NDR55564.1 methyltransferase domain-containing protein [Pseudoruegeria sp. M32A2M]